MRPQTFNEFIGQENACQQLQLSIEYALSKKCRLDHILLTGPAGLGKTTLSRIVANTIGSTCIETISSIYKQPRDIINTLVRLKENDVLFIDEIHALPLTVQEFLYPAMEDFQISMVYGKKARRSILLELENFILIGATTIEGLLSKPMLDRFGIICRLKPYKKKDLAIIIIKAAESLNLKVDHKALKLIADRCRATPRIALRQLKRIKDLCLDNAVTEDRCLQMYQILGITEYGLTDDDRKTLQILYESESPIGIQTLAAMTNISRDTLENVIEPHLMRCGFMTRTARGRKITEQGMKLMIDNFNTMK